MIIEFFSLSYLWFRTEEKIHPKAVSDVFRGEEFWKLFCLGGWGRNGSFGGKECLGRARGWRKLCILTIKLQFPKILPTLYVPFPLAVSWTLYIELHYKKCIFLNMSTKLV